MPLIKPLLYLNIISLACLQHVRAVGIGIGIGNRNRE